MAKYGEALARLDLKKPIVLWYPTYFLYTRLNFVVTTLFLWDNPSILILTRILSALISFVAINYVKPFDTKRNNKLEMANKVVLIFLMDMLVIQTNVLNDGNVDD